MKLLTYDRLRESVHVETLENGLTIYVIPKSEYNKSVAIFATNYGGADRRFRLEDGWHDTPAGVAHFLEHKMFDMPDGNALVQLSQNGASPNAFTSASKTAYHFESTGGFKENLRLLLRFVSTPYFTEESVKKEQGIIGQEIRMTEDDPDFCLYQNLMRSLYAHNPVRDSVAGTVESIAEITPEILYNCHKAFYTPPNMVLVVAGNVDPVRVADMAAEILPREGKAPAERDYGPAEALEPCAREVEAHMDVALPMFMTGAKIRRERGGQNRFRQELLGDMALELLAGRGSALYARLYREGLINDQFFAGTTWFPDGAAAVFGGESRDMAAVQAAVLEEAARFAQDGPDMDRFRRVKKAALGSELMSLDSLYGLCARRTEGHFGGFDPMLATEALESLTAEDIVGFIRENLAEERLATSRILPKA